MSDPQNNMSTNFDQMNLSRSLLKAIADQNYEKPSAIQAKAIPVVLSGKDVMAAAQTGTGKTAAFTLPILQQLEKGKPAQSNHVRVLILTPTRELAAQVQASVETYSKYLKISSAVVYGGVKINPQMMKLRKGVDVLVATPGRLIDLHQQGAVKFNHLEILVLDEADRMLDMGFIRDIKKILNLLPKKRQNLLFSATFSNEIRALAKNMVVNPVEISVNPPNSTVKKIKQWVYPVDKKQKSALLAHLINENTWHQVLVFTRTKHGANKLARYLDKQKIMAVPIHGNKSQSARTKALAGFKNGEIRVLVATDIAARGIDIEQLPHVVNFDLPHVAEDYVHRIGRTGRAGSAGEAISLVSADEIKQLKSIERLTKQVIQRELIDGFEPDHDLPESSLDTRPIKLAKPKKRSSYNKSPTNKSPYKKDFKSKSSMNKSNQKSRNQNTVKKRPENR